MVDSINGDEFEQTQGDSEGQGSLACCSPWGRKELDTTEGRNKWYLIPLSSSVSWSLLKFMSIELVTLYNHLIFSSSSPFAFNLSQHQGLIQRVGSSHHVGKILELEPPNTELAVAGGGRFS